MKIRNLKIRTRLTIGFVVIVFLIATLGAIALTYISNLTTSTENIYNHPFTVSNAVRDIKSNIIAMHRSMKDVAMADNDIQMNHAKNQVSHYEDTVYAKFEIVFSRFLGDMKDVQKAYNSFAEWHEIREEVILLWSKGEKKDAIAITKGKGAEHVQLLLDDVDVMVDFASKKAIEFFSNTQESEHRYYNVLMFVLLSSLFISVIIVVLISRSIIIPVKSMNEVAIKIDRGDLSAKNEIIYKDEINDLAKSFNRMIDSINERNSILSGLADISSSLHGLVTLKEFASTILTKYVELTNAHFASFFIYDNEIDSFKPVDSIGLSMSKLSSFSSDNAPVEIDHVLKNKNVYILSKIEEGNYFNFESVLGKMLLKELVTIAIVEKEKVVAIISCGSLSSFSSSSKDIFYQSQNTLNTSFSTLLSSIKTNQYSKELANTNERLELQSEELIEQSQELKEQSEELKITSDNLQEQNIELELQRKEVEEANRLKSEFLSNMSHELRTPLNSINALSKVLLLQSSEKLDKEENKYLEIIERNGKRLLTLINDILDLSKVESGKMELNLSNFNLRKAIKFSVGNLKPLANEKNLAINIKTDSDIEIESDEGRLHQVLTNIIGNAIKFTEKGEINIFFEEKDGITTIKVQDTGVGIKKEALPYIFNEFRQADGTTSRKYEGTGLGLAIANKIVNSLNGNITCDSSEGVGSIFTITLPTFWDLASKRKKIRSPEPRIIEGKKSILVVDDDHSFIEDLSDQLYKQGYNVIQASSGKEALELAIKYIPYAITLDIVMPEMDGWEVLQNLKANRITSQIPVIIISNSDESDTSVALGAVGYIQKPVDREELIGEMQKIKYNAKSILLVDDNEVDILHTKNMIGTDQYEITSCNTGEECLTILDKQTPDLLILDLMMPGMNGFQILNEIRNREHLKKLPVIIVTAKDLTNEEKGYLNERAAAILTKDTSSSDLVHEVSNIIHSLSHDSIPKLTMDEKNILIVEDNEAAYIQVRNVLEDNGMKVHHAFNGIEAIEYLKVNKPDGIILDLMMPEMDGFELLENIRNFEQTKDIPVLVLTAKSLTKKELSRLKSNNISQMIQKGDINIDELLSYVNDMTSKNSKIFTIPPKESKQIGKKPTIVIVEDNPDNRITLKALLGKNYQIYEAEDGESGLSLIMEVIPDLVLLDISLPKMDGFEVVKKLKDEEKVVNVPVIAVTAKAMKNDREEIIEAGCDDYISKPININELNTILQKYLDI